jgi:hypothetical protein
MRQAFIAGVAALLLVLLGAGGPGFGESAPQARKPAIVLAPPPGVAPETTEVPNRQPPPVARKKPTPPKKVSAPQRAPEKPAAKKAPAKKSPPRKVPANKAPDRAAASPAPQAKNCDYCYGCESMAAICKRQWVCGKRYTDRLAAGLCRR